MTRRLADDGVGVFFADACNDLCEALRPVAPPCTGPPAGHLGTCGMVTLAGMGASNAQRGRAFQSALECAARWMVVLKTNVGPPIPKDWADYIGSNLSRSRLVLTN